MFELKTFTGQPLTREWAQERARWEVLFEAIQTNGQSESHPSLSPATSCGTGATSISSPKSRA